MFFLFQQNNVEKEKLVREFAISVLLVCYKQKESRIKQGLVCLHEHPSKKIQEKKIYAHALIRVALREKCFYSEFFWSVFSRIWAEYGPEKFQIRTLFMQCSIYYQHLSKE